MGTPRKGRSPQGHECLCKARDSGRAGGAMKEALRSTSPVGLQEPLWDWSKLIPSPVLALPIRRQQNSVPTRAVHGHQDFYPTPGR